ncbi:MAG: N-acetyl sugar amidotransferase [Erysipelotrichaceae bacterium]
MKYCKKCVMPDTRPGIKFNKEGVCSACLAHEHKKSVDYELRFKELELLCNKYRGMNGDSYDCAIAVSGGKDSFFQVYVMKELMHMNPILFSVEDNFTMTEAGKHNLKMISEAFGCNIVSLKPDIRTQKKLMRKTFEHYGKPTWFIDRLIYTYPLKMAVKFNTPLIVYGENVSFEYGGGDAKETYSAREILENGVASDIEYSELIDQTITMKDLSLTIAPSNEELKELDPIYLSYFVEWNSYKNYSFAKKRGFHDLTHEWDRTMMAENFDQVDSKAYLVHAWLKYPKFGHACATDYTSRFIRYGMMDRDEAIKIVKEKDHNLDPICVKDFCEFADYSEKEFWEIIDKLYNKEIFKKDKCGNWVLKNPVWEN